MNLQELIVVPVIISSGMIGGVLSIQSDNGALGGILGVLLGCAIAAILLGIFSLRSTLLNWRTRALIPNCQTRLSDCQAKVSQIVRDKGELDAIFETRWNGEFTILIKPDLIHTMKFVVMLNHSAAWTPPDHIQHAIKSIFMNQADLTTSLHHKLWMRFVAHNLSWSEQKPRYSAHEKVAARHRLAHLPIAPTALLLAA